jgi:alpha/beta superfamily hydrolase
MTDTLGDCEKSKLIIQGEQDQYGGPSKLAPWFEQLPEPKQLVMVPGADHFFSDFQTELYQAVYAYFKDGNSAVGPLPGM